MLGRKEERRERKHQRLMKRIVQRAQRGYGTWGRHNPLKPGEVETEVIGDLSIRVIRADGSVEDLGVVGEVYVEGGEN